MMRMVYKRIIIFLLIAFGASGCGRRSVPPPTHRRVPCDEEVNQDQPAPLKPSVPSEESAFNIPSANPSACSADEGVQHNVVAKEKVPAKKLPSIKPLDQTIFPSHHQPAHAHNPVAENPFYMAELSDRSQVTDADHTKEANHENGLNRRLSVGGAAHAASLAATMVNPSEGAISHLEEKGQQIDPIACAFQDASGEEGEAEILSMEGKSLAMIPYAPSEDIKKMVMQCQGEFQASIKEMAHTGFNGRMRGGVAALCTRLEGMKLKEQTFIDEVVTHLKVNTLPIKIVEKQNALILKQHMGNLYPINALHSEVKGLLNPESLQVAGGAKNIKTPLHRRRKLVLGERYPVKIGVKPSICGLTWTQISVYVGRYLIEQGAGEQHRARGLQLLCQVEMLKKKNKQEYRSGNYELYDCEPVVFDILQKRQEILKEELLGLRQLRSRLMQACATTSEEAAQCDIPLKGVRGLEIYGVEDCYEIDSSDDERACPRSRAKFIKGIAKGIAAAVAKWQVGRPSSTRKKSFLANAREAMGSRGEEEQGRKWGDVIIDGIRRALALKNRTGNWKSNLLLGIGGEVCDLLDQPEAEKRDTQIAIQFGRNAHVFRAVNALPVARGVVQLEIEKDIKKRASMIKEGVVVSREMVILGYRIAYTAHRDNDLFMVDTIQSLGPMQPMMSSDDCLEL